MDKHRVRRFEDLYVWQKARNLVIEVYKLTKLPTWRDASLANQIQRAIVSVLSNIAEGFERGTKEEFLYFLYVARGSCGEVRAQLYIALDLKYITKPDFERVFDLADHESRLLVNTINGLKLKGQLGQKYQKPVDKKLEEFEAYLGRVGRGEEKWDDEKFK